MIRKNDVVQFIENHKWCGCLGIITEVKKLSGGRYRFQIGVPLPSNNDKTGTAFIFDDGSGIERVGKAVLTLSVEEG